MLTLISFSFVIQPKTILAAVEAIMKKYGKIDILVNSKFLNF